MRGIASMATRLLLAELVPLWSDRSGHPAVVESVGGVDAARRIRSGEPCDIAVLAEDAIAALVADGRLHEGTTIARSPLAIAVPRGADGFDVSTVAALRHAVRLAPSIGLSTGPSGTRMQELFASWGLAGSLGPKTVVAAPGVPVARLVASGEVALGFQQLPELVHEAGIRVLPMPSGSAIETTFTAAVATRCRSPELAEALISFLASSDESVTARRRLGLSGGASRPAAR